MLPDPRGHHWTPKAKSPEDWLVNGGGWQVGKFVKTGFLTGNAERWLDSQIFFIFIFNPWSDSVVHLYNYRMRLRLGARSAT